MSSEDTIVKENKLIKALIPKISEFFKTKEYLEKSQLSEFLNFIDLSTWNEKDKELFWSEISKDKGQPSNKVQKVLLIKNLTEYIHIHSSELFQPEASLKDSVLNFIKNPKDLKIDIDPENEQMFEFYRLLATIQFSTSKIIPIYTLDEHLKSNSFINLNKDTVLEIMEELLKEKCTSIKKEQYISVMEQMEKKFRTQMEERSKRKRVFTDEELDHPELYSFNDLMAMNKILLNIMDSLFLSHEKACENERNNEKLKAEFFNKSFKVFINNAKLYLYEIIRIYNEQKQKFDYFECSLVSKNTLYKQQINDLNEEIRREKEIEEYKSKEALQALNIEIINEKNKHQKTENDLKLLKKENLKATEDLLLTKNKLLNLEKQIEERDNKINSIKKENEIMSEKYRDVLSTLNGQLFNAKEKQKRTDEIIKNMKLNDKQRLLVNKDPQELLSYIVEKDNYCVTIENKNKDLLEKISQLETTKENIENELYELKSKKLSLENKISNLTKENEELQKTLDEQKEEKSFLLSNIIESNEDNNTNNNANNNKNIVLIKVNSTQVNLKGIPSKKIKNEKRNDKNYDYLCLRMDEKIVKNLNDEYYNGSSNLIFSEYINYLDDEKEIFECILFITNNYLYLFNNVIYKKCFSIPIDDLRNVFISTLNNYVSMTFENGEIINFEIFRILELMNFLKALNALHKTKQKININMSDYNNQFVKNNPNNFTVTAYHGRSIFSGYLQKRVESFLKTGLEKRFVDLTEIGLIIMDSPNGKPLEIINLLFAKFTIYNGGDGVYCFCLNIGKVKHTFSCDSEFLRNKWISEFEKWIKKISQEETISV